VAPSLGRLRTLSIRLRFTCPTLVMNRKSLGLVAPGLGVFLAPGVSRVVCLGGPDYDAPIPEGGG